MSYPFIIWTLQRTGGTSLTDLLMDLSEHRRAEHEPFNWDKKQPRQFWPIAQGWNRTRDAAALARALDEVFAQRFLVKHCYELHDPGFNEHLLRAAVRAGYRQLHLLRRDEGARVISKFVAKVNGAWFKEYAAEIFAQVRDTKRRLRPLPVADIVEYYRTSKLRSDEVGRWLAEFGAEYELLYYEDLYVGGRAARLARLAGLLAFLDLPADTIDRHRERIDDKIFGGGQDTGSVLAHIPNLALVCEALAAAGCPAPQAGA